ncbi:LOW QUALITY PROTEIN: polycomb group RING finger protein 6 [Dermochelys coriacea]|uniref:LOW QUALITY PROTEIN: polycomb group RING finger protein 6 n=1 Tax=Dermochelys coriacea TaxID=27794 RepID=UPI001CA8E3E6|nr:LOW QUALITY PROTEIN: polycomb group RING finger protein 6 [Dermochelys coriacea]
MCTVSSSSRRSTLRFPACFFTAITHAHCRTRRLGGAASEEEGLRTTFPVVPSGAAADPAVAVPPPPAAMDMEVDVGSVISGLSGGDGAGLGPGEEELEVGGAPGCSGAGSLQFDFERSRSESSGEEEEEELEEEELEGGPGAGFGACREEEGELDSDAERERMINLSELTPYILCSICKGYFIDATTITECLHTFCKSCIVRHFYYSNRCPKCNIVVHQTQPLYNIRLDRQLQDIVYKLVVNLEDREKKQMHDFYKERGLEVPKPAVPQPVPVSRGRPRKVLGSVFRIPPELDVSLLLEFIGANEGAGNFKPLEKKFVRVSGEATIGHVEKFLRRKMDLDPACQVDIICGDHLLEHYQTLREIRRAIGDSAMQDGLLVLHYGLVVSPLTVT